MKFKCEEKFPVVMDDASREVRVLYSTDGSAAYAEYMFSSGMLTRTLAITEKPPWRVITSCRDMEVVVVMPS